MAMIGAGIAVWGAWQCLAVLLSDDNPVARDANSGCIWIIGIVAALATFGLVDAL